MNKQSNIKGLRVEVRDNNVNTALKKLKKKVDESGRLIDVIKKSHYEKPTETKKRKKGAARARWLKKLAADALPKKNF